MQPVNCVPMQMLIDLCKLNYQCCLMPDVRHLWGIVSTLWRGCVNVVSVRRDVNYCESLRSSQTSITWAFWSTALHAGSPSSGSWNVYSCNTQRCPRTSQARTTTSRPGEMGLRSFQGSLHQTDTSVPAVRSPCVDGVQQTVSRIPTPSWHFCFCSSFSLCWWSSTYCFKDPYTKLTLLFL